MQPEGILVSEERFLGNVPNVTSDNNAVVDK